MGEGKSNPRDQTPSRSDARDKTGNWRAMTNKEVEDLVEVTEEIAHRIMHSGLYNIDLAKAKNISPEAGKILGRVSEACERANGEFDKLLKKREKEEITEEQFGELLSNLPASLNSLVLALDMSQKPTIEAFLEEFNKNPTDLDLIFSKVDRLDGEENAELLASFKGGTLNLAGLNFLTSEEARALAKYKTHDREREGFNYTPQVFMYMDHIREISDSALKELMNFEGILTIGLKELSASQLEILKNKRDYPVELSDLQSISPEALKLLGAGTSRLKVAQQSSMEDSAYLFGNLLIPQLAVEKSLKRLRTEDDIRGLSPEAMHLIEQWIPFFDKRRAFKDVVVEQSQEMQKKLKAAGVSNPELFYNLNARHDISGLVADIVGWLKGLPKSDDYDFFLQRFKTESQTDFQESADFIGIYKDEIIQAMADTVHLVSLRKKEPESAQDLQKKIKLLEKKVESGQLQSRALKQTKRSLEALKRKMATTDSTKNKKGVPEQAEELLARFQEFEYKRPGVGGFRLSSRNQAELTLGDKCGDCTSASISGMNFWTVPTWLTDPGGTFLLQYDEKGELVHKFYIIWAERNDKKPILSIDSMELGNAQKEKQGMNEDPADPKKEQGQTIEAMDFILKWLSDMGLDSDRLYATKISNTGTMELAGYPTQIVSFTKFDGLDGVVRVIRAVDPELKITPEVYLQSYKNFTYEEGGGDEKRVDAIEIYNLVESAISHYLNVELVNEEDQKLRGEFKAIIEHAKINNQEASRKLRVFIFTNDKTKAMDYLQVNGIRIDKFLHNKKLNFDGYFTAMLGQVGGSSLSDYVKSNLYNIVPADQTKSKK